MAVDSRTRRRFITRSGSVPRRQLRSAVGLALVVGVPLIPGLPSYAAPPASPGAVTVLTPPYASASGSCLLTAFSTPAVSRCEETHDATTGRLGVHLDAFNPGTPVPARSAARNAMSAMFTLTAPANAVDFTVTTRIDRLEISTEGNPTKYEDVELRVSSHHSACPDCGGGGWLTVKRSWGDGSSEMSLVDYEETTTFSMTSWEGPLPAGTITVTLENYESLHVYGQAYDSPPPDPVCGVLWMIQCDPLTPTITAGSAAIDIDLVMSQVTAQPR